MPRYAFGDFRLDVSERQLVRGAVPVPLPNKAFDLLDLLVRNAGKVVSKDDILKSLWPDTFVEEANLPNLISLLRKTLGDDSDKPHIVQTVPKLGYRFIAKLAPTENGAAAHRTIRFLAFPFRTTDPELQPLCLSFAESMEGALSELNSFVVRPRQVATRFVPEQWDPKTVAREAEVDLVLIGSMETRNTRLHVTAELLDAPEAAVLWSEKWDLTSDELPNLKNAIMQLILRTLVRNSRLPSGATRSSVSARARELFLRANECALVRSAENMKHARDLYIASTELDPFHAPTWAHLGRCYRWLEKFGLAPSPNGPHSQAAFQRAFSLDPHHADAHVWYTPLQCDLGDAEHAVARLLRQLEHDSDRPALFAALVHACRYCGLLEESLAAHSRAVALDSDLPTSVAHSFFALGDYDRALYWYDAKPGVYLDALALTMLGRHDDASSLLWTRHERLQALPALVLSLEAFLKGDREAGLAAIRSATQEQEAEAVFYLARQAAIFSDQALALSLLRRSLDGGYGCAYELEHDPWLKEIRACSEFRNMLASARTREQSARKAFMTASGPRLLPKDPYLPAIASADFSP